LIELTAFDASILAMAAVVHTPSIVRTLFNRIFVTVTSEVVQPDSSITLTKECLTLGKTTTEF
jgi:hypothetical protein